MTFNNLPTALLGLALIALLGGCCTSGSCGSAASSSDQVYSAPSAPSYDQAPASDCGCGCSAATDSAMSYESSGTEVISDNYYSPSTETPYAIGETTSSVSQPTPIVDSPAVGETSGFTAGSATKTNELPGNLLPGN